MRKTFFTFICLILSCQLLTAQNWDVNTLHTINKWDVHGISRGLSHSGMILPVGIPTAMGIYALIQKDQALLKDAVFIGTSVIEAVCSMLVVISSVLRRLRSLSISSLCTR